MYARSPVDTKLCCWTRICLLFARVLAGFIRSGITVHRGHGSATERLTLSGGWSGEAATPSYMGDGKQEVSVVDVRHAWQFDPAVREALPTEWMKTSCACTFFWFPFWWWCLIVGAGAAWLLGRRRPLACSRQARGERGGYRRRLGDRDDQEAEGRGGGGGRRARGAGRGGDRQVMGGRAAFGCAAQGYYE